MARRRKNPAAPAVIGASDAKVHLFELLDRAESGEVITITRKGVPVPKLGPVTPAREIKPLDAVRSRVRAFQDAHPLEGVTTRDLVNEGRRR